MSIRAMGLNWADYTIIAIILVSTLISIIRGFVREALSLVIWVVAFWIAFKFAGQAAPLLKEYITSETIRLVASFALLMIGVLIVGAFTNYLINLLVNKTGLSGTDRLLGVLFGVVRGTLLVGVLLLVGQLSNLQKERWWTTSHLIPQFDSLVYWMEGFLPRQMAHLSEVVDSPEVAQKKAFEKEVNAPALSH